MISHLWIGITICAAASQTARNAAQREALDVLGPASAAYMRFLYGFPFALMFLLIASLFYGAPPLPPLSAVGWCAAGASAQIAATILMLAAMQDRSFLVVTAYTKTEPVQTALFGFVFLHETLSGSVIVSIIGATLGVVGLSWPDCSVGQQNSYSLRAAFFGLVAASFFAFAAIAFRGAVLSFHGLSSSFVAAFILALALLMQCLMIISLLAMQDLYAFFCTKKASQAGLRTLMAIARLWRVSLGAGFFGALASQLWFLAFALQSVARVRTLALVEVFFAQIASQKLFHQKPSKKELICIALILFGVTGVLLN